MIKDWAGTAAGALGGAVLALLAVYGLSAEGLLPAPRNDAAIHDYLMAHPDILVAMTAKLQMQQTESDDKARQAAVTKLGDKVFFDPKLAFVTGPANAKTTFVEFFDYNCPYCRASNAAVKAFYEAHKNDARFAFIEFPIKGNDSVAAARLAIAARQQPDKYLAYHFAMMRQEGLVTADAAVQIAKQVGLNLQQLQKDEQDPQVSATINAALSLAQAADIDGTPAFVIDGKVREGAVDSEKLAQLTGNRS